MRPNKPKATSRASGLGVAKCMLKDGLDWVRGFPAGPPAEGCIPWVVVREIGRDPRLEPVAVTGETLRKATHALVTLRQRFPRILPTLVPDLARWGPAIERRLEILSAALHGRGSLPTPDELATGAGLPTDDVAFVRRELRRDGTLSWLLEPLVWVLEPHPERLAAAVAFVRGRSRELTRLSARLRPAADLPLLVRLCELAAVEPERTLRGPLEMLFDDRAWSVPTSGRRDFADGLWTELESASLDVSGPIGPVKASLATLLAVQKAKALEAGCLGRWLLEHLSALPRIEVSARRRDLRILDLVLPRDLLREASRWWTEVEGSWTAVMSRILPLPDDAPASPALGRIDEAIAQAERSAPVALDVADLLRAVARISRAEDTRLWTEAVAVLGRVPEWHRGMPLRSNLLLYWDLLDREVPRSAEPLRRVLRAERSYLSAVRGFVEAALGPWENLDPSLGLYPCDRTPEWLALQGGLDPAEISRLFRCLEALARPGARESLRPAFQLEATWRVLGWTLRLRRDGAQAAGLVEELVRKRAVEGTERLGEHLFASLARIGGADPARVAALCKDLSVLEPGESRALSLLVKGFDDDATIGGLLAGGELPRLRVAARRFALLCALHGGPRAGKGVRTASRPSGGPVSSSAAGADRRWIDAYPEDLAVALRALAAADPRAESSAARTLAGYFPDPEELRLEIAAIESRLPSVPPTRAEGMRKRLEALRQRLEGPAGPLSPEKASHLREKIERRAAVARLRSWERSVGLALERAFAKRLGGPVPREWLDDPRRWSVIEGILRLGDRRFRALGLRLLKARLGPEPWDLRDAPENRGYLEGLRRLGIRTEPWLAGSDAVEGPGPEGHPVRMSIERDPLEVLRMGEPFGTCLSPGGSNFFSAVANAVDINKKVLYARDSRGEIVGRCLLALTDDGSILTFNPYCVDHRIDVGALATEFVTRLGREMGTLCVPEGSVRKLVAHEWYDDGPVDLTGSWTVLDAGSDFRKRLATAPLEEIPKLCDDAFAPAGLTGATLPLVLELDEVVRRPELVPRLLPAGRPLDDLPVPSVLRAAELAKAAGDVAASKRILRSALGRVGRRRHPYLVPRLAGLLIDAGQADVALRVLRETRDRGVRRWDDEPIDRLEIAARAHDALARPALALRLYRRVLRYWDHEPLRRRVAHLEEMLGR